MPRKKTVPSAAGQTTAADKAMAHVPAADGPTIIAQIRYWHRQRCFAMEQRKRNDLALGAFLRIQLGWSKELPDKERKRIADQAAELIDEGGAGSEWEQVIAASHAARKPFADIEARAVKEMSALAEQFPAWLAFGEGIRGFGPASLAVIVGEAGGLSNYANPGKLWKRMGLAVMGDVRQGGLAKNASKEAWIEHGYNRQRRSRMWNIGDALIKGNRDGEYRKIYLERKAYELARDPEMKPIKAHRRAQRYMEKRLLKNLWQAWRRAIVHEQPIHGVPAADLERQTDEVVNSRQAMSAVRSTDADLSTLAAMSSASIPAKAGKRRAGPTVQPRLSMPAATIPSAVTRSGRPGDDFSPNDLLPPATIDVALPS